MRGATPVPVSGLGSGSGVIAIAAGAFHSLALKSDGSVLAWGRNDSGQLGNGTTTGFAVPAVVSGFGSGSGVSSIAAGGAHNLALKSDGSVWAWGADFSGQLGNGVFTAYINTPVAASGLASGSGVVAVAAGDRYSLALKSDGSVLQWGANHLGGLSGGFNSNTPVPLSGFGSGSGVSAIAAGGSHNLALRSDGSVWAWGWNVDGQLGTGTTSDSLTPVQVLGLNGGVAIGLGPESSHSLAIVQPVATLSTSSLNFGSQLTGTLSPSQMITITNNGQEPVTISGFAPSGADPGDFPVSVPPTPVILSPSTNTAVSVAFDPSGAGARLATLLINDNGFQAPQVVTMGGNGVLQADLAISLGASPNPVNANRNLTYTIGVQNLGPTPAPSVIVTDVLPGGTQFASIKTSQGSCNTPAAGTTGTVACNLGTLNNSGTASITLVVSLTVPGGSSVTNTASATSGAPDPVLANNSVTVVTQVFGTRH